MKLLLDTHAFLWLSVNSDKLGRKAREKLSQSGTQVYLSAASVWEIAIKSELGKLKLDDPVQVYLELGARAGILPLPVEFSHAVRVEGLPPHHRDPFDRMLVAQALTEGMTLVSGDRAMKPYKVPLLW